MQERARTLETPPEMPVEHARILVLTPVREGPAWRYCLNVSPRAVYLTDFSRLDLASALEPEPVPCRLPYSGSWSGGICMHLPSPSRKPGRCLG